jgi:hypothetical protein
MALAETSSLYTTLRLLTLADPAMPISPTYVAAGYPLCEPFVCVCVCVRVRHSIGTTAAFASPGRQW